MILIGQYDSPFVRRVGIAMTLYGLDFEHRPWSASGDREKMAKVNPTLRVPALVLDDGEVLTESGAILDHLDEVHGRGRALIAASGETRRRAFATIALATSMVDKAVSLFYEKALHEHPSQVWMDRCRDQIGGILALLEKDRAGRPAPYWFGENISHADIAVACALRFLKDAHPGLADIETLPALRAHADRCEALPVFSRISQPFIPPA